jgi:hypothetical protein
MGKGRPAPISSFGAGQGENNISEFKGEIGPPPILPFGGGQCEFRLYFWMRARAWQSLCLLA